MSFSLIDGSEIVIASVASVPPEPADRSSPTSWRSVGDAAGHVLSGVAYRYAVASCAYPTLRTEGGEWVEEIIPIAASAE